MHNKNILTSPYPPCFLSCFLSQEGDHLGYYVGPNPATNRRDGKESNLIKEPRRVREWNELS